jgi:hypothetical protein
MCFRGRDVFLKAAHLLPPEMRRYMPVPGVADQGKRDYYYGGSDDSVRGKYGRPESVYAAQRLAAAAAGVEGWGPAAQESRYAPFQHHKTDAYSNQKVRFVLLF